MRFDRQVEDLLIVLYHREMEHSLGDGANMSWSFESAFRTIPGRVDPALVGAIQDEFIRRGYGKFNGNMGGFRLLPRGEAAAIEILETRRPKGFLELALSLPWTTILAFISAVAAVIAAVPVARDLVR